MRRHDRARCERCRPTSLDRRGRARPKPASSCPLGGHFSDPRLMLVEAPCVQLVRQLRCFGLLPDRLWSPVVHNLRRYFDMLLPVCACAVSGGSSTCSSGWHRGLLSVRACVGQDKTVRCVRRVVRGELAMGLGCDANTDDHRGQPEAPGWWRWFGYFNRLPRVPGGSSLAQRHGRELFHERAKARRPRPRRHELSLSPAARPCDASESVGRRPIGVPVPPVQAQAPGC